MAFRCVAAHAGTLLRLRGTPAVTTATTHNLWMPLARRFATAVEDAEGKIARARVCVCVCLAAAVLLGGLPSNHFTNVERVHIVFSS
jgi:hypothetical protein